MRLLVITLFVLLLVTQYQLWMGEGGLVERRAMHTRLQELEDEHRSTQERNQQLQRSLQAYTSDSQGALSGIEAHARRDLGFIKKGETFYWVIEEE